MKKYILLALLFCHYSAYFQSSEVKKDEDSLVRLLKKSTTDREKMVLYYELVRSCQFNDSIKIEKYSKLLLELSKKRNSSFGLGLYYLNKGNSIFSKGKNKKAIDYSVKAYELLKNEKERETKYYLTAVISLARTYSRFDEDILLKKILDENQKLFHQFGDAKLLGDYYYYYSACYVFSIDKRETMCYKKAFHYYQMCNNVDGKVWVYYRIAKSYKKLKLNSETLKYLNYAIDLDPNPEDKNMLQVEKAKILNVLGNYKEAKVIIDSALAYFSKANLTATDAYWMSKLAEAKSEFGLRNYKRSIQICSQVIDNTNKSATVINANNTMSASYFELGQFATAKKYIEKSKELIDVRKERTGDLALEDYYTTLSKVEGALGNYKEAWLYNQKYIDYSNKTSKKIEKEQYEQYQIQFEVAEKENQIKQLKIEALQKNLLVQKQRNYILLAAFVLIVAAIAFITFIMFYRTIKEKNKTIEENVTKLEKSLKEKEILLKEIHHRVKNNFQLVTSLLNIQAREVGSKELDEFIEKGQSRIISMALIHENLYQTDKLDKVNFQDYVENLVENIKSSFQYQNDKITTKVKTETSNFDIQTSIPLGLIINELYCNILKYAFPNREGNILIELIKKEERNYQLTIADDGVGMGETTKSAKSIGLELVYMLVEQLNGTIELENSSGTKYTINFREIVG